MELVETIGWIAGFLFAICGAPLAWDAYQKKEVQTSSLFLWTWYLAEWLMFYYVFNKHGWDLPLLFNYFLNIIFVSIVLYYKYRGKNV